MFKQKKLLLTIALLIVVLSTIIGSTYSWFASRTYSTTNLEASIQRQYFESGDGSSTNPYEIKRPIQLYYFSWLQQMGYFNDEKGSTGTINQQYFYLSDDLEMNGFTLPSIGTAEYPFVGNFDGRGHVISNLCIQNNHEDFTNEPKNAGYETKDDTQIVGFFGVVGSLDGTNTVNGCTYNSSINQIKNVCLNSVAITSETPKDEKTLIGIVAGYVNADISGVAVCNSAIFVKSGLNAIGNSIFTKISDYSTIGYCRDTYINQIQITNVALSDILIQTDSSGEGGSGSGQTGPGGEPIDDVPGNAWGGSINMVNLYSRLSDIYNNKADQSNSYYTKETRYDFIDYPEYNRVEGRSDGGTVTTGFTSEIVGTEYYLNNFAIYDENYDEGAMTFSQGLFGNNDYIYLMGEIDTSFDDNPYTTKYSIVHTLERQDATGMYIHSGSNYLSVELNSGTPSLVNKTSEGEASIWFITSDNRIFTQIDGENYFLVYEDTTTGIGIPTLSVVSSTSTNKVYWTKSGDNISIILLNRKKTLFASAKDLTVYIRYQNGWSLVENSTSTMFISDGTNYLALSGSGNYLNAANSTSQSGATPWTYNSDDHTIYADIGGTQYYLMNNNGVLQAVSSSVLSGTATYWVPGTSNGKSYIKNTIGSVEYSIEYHNGWMLWPSSNYRIHYGGYYMIVTQVSGGYSINKTTDASQATNWVFTNGTSGGKISTVLNNTVYYLAVTGSTNSASLTLSTSVQTEWSTEAPNLNGYFEGNVSTYSIKTTYNDVLYYLFCENGVWSVVKGSDNRCVVGYKYSFVSGGSKKNAIWLSHNLNTGSGDNFTYCSNLEETVIFYLDSDLHLYCKSGSQKLYLGIYFSSIYSVHSETSIRFYMTLSITSDGKLKCTYKNGTKYLSCTGERFGYGHTYDAILSRPPMSLDLVSGQSVNFVTNNGSNEVDEFESNYFKEVLGSPENITETSISKLHGTYIPITTVSATDLLTSKRNTGYIVGGSNYRKYGGTSSYRLGDVRVAQYDLSTLASGYFDQETREILKILTANNEEYDMTQGSSYFETAYPKIQSILQNDASEMMYGIHFMNAPVSSSNTIIAEKATIEHILYYDYELPESCIDFTLANSGYINFFAGTYATDTIVGDNDAFFSMHQVFRWQDTLPDNAIVAIFTCENRPTVFKMNNGKYYYNNNGTITYIYNIDNMFATGKSIDELYSQVTSGVYMDKNNPSNTLYYTLRNDVTSNHYYTFNISNSSFGNYYQALSSNYISITNIKEIKQIKAIYSKYTAAGASTLATKEMIYKYSDGSYSKGSYSTISGITTNADGSVTYNETKFNLIFDMTWIDTSSELVTNAIYYFEIPVVSGEYCLGSVSGGKGAYLLYLDLSTNASTGENQGGVVSEIALIETKTTTIETYSYPKGISIIEDASTYSSTSVPTLKDYETIGIALSNPDNFTISRSGDQITITNTTTGTILYVGYGLDLTNTTLTIQPQKTTMITEETTVIQSIQEDAQGKETVDTKTYVSSNTMVVNNVKLEIEEDSVLRVSTYVLLDSDVDLANPDETPIDIEVNLNVDQNAGFTLSSIQAIVSNLYTESLEVKLEELQSNLSYSYKKQNGTTYETITVEYTLNVSPTSLDEVGKVVTLSPN